MIFTETALKGVWLIDPLVLRDERGAFMRAFCKREFAENGITNGAIEFVQINHSFNLYRGTVRGLHYQTPPSSETKLIRCIRGAVMDFVVDVRAGSPTFLQWVSVELSARNLRMILIPEGFAHGFQTLKNNTELLYHHTEYYAPQHEQALNVFDPMLSISLPLPVSVISERDRNHPMLTTDFEGIHFAKGIHL
jgi:dTDP-4-dehydrorhamnose 3,5-epimerase